MEGTLFNYIMFLKNCISHIISMKYIMNNITNSFQLSHHQTGEITSITIYQIRFPAFSLPIFTCIPKSRKVSSRGDSPGHCSEISNAILLHQPLGTRNLRAYHPKLMLFKKSPNFHVITCKYPNFCKIFKIKFTSTSS
ncbi:hypothetical protein AMTRI_Chr01g114470 [Amborella trichopoda]